MTSTITDPLVIAIDSSTTATKAIVVDAAGTVVAEGRSEIDLKHPRTSHYEHDPLQWWESTNAAVGTAVAALNPADAARIAAMCMTHQRETFAPFAADGTPLRDGILWMDTRAADQIARFGSPAIHAKSGKPADTSSALFKLAWLKENEPDTVPSADKVVEVHGYLVYRLTGRWVSSTASADSLGMLDIAAMDYDPGLMDLAGVRHDQMADLVAPGEIIGEISADITEAWGLRQRVLLVAGMGDGQAAGIGAAAVSLDTMYLNLGTGVVGGVHSPSYAYGDVYRTLVAGIPGMFDFELCLGSGAFLAGWFRKGFGRPELDGRPDPELEAAAAALPPGSHGLLTMPYWNAVQAPHWDPTARGAVVGWRDTHQRPAMYRSILEAIGLEMRHCIERLGTENGIHITAARATGGGTRSPMWRRIMTDALGLPITACQEDEITALGAAMTAMSVTGVHGAPDVAAYATAMARFGDTTEPDAKASAVYNELSQIQRKLYPALKEVNDDINAFLERHPE